jgi:hypothetical protein
MRKPADSRMSGLIEVGSAFTADSDLRDAMIDLPGLIALGLPDREIVDKLGVKGIDVDLVAYVRGRVDEYRAENF